MNFREGLNLPEIEYNILKPLSSNEDIVIQKTDKGNAIVVLYKNDYIQDMMSILNNTSKFSKVNIPKRKYMPSSTAVHTDQ